MGNYVKAVILIIILLLFITFGVKNSQPVRLSYYFNILNTDLPLYGVVYVSMVIGILIGLAVGLRNRFMLKRELKDLDKEYRDLREGIDMPGDRSEKTLEE